MQRSVLIVDDERNMLLVMKLTVVVAYLLLPHLAG